MNGQASLCSVCTNGVPPAWHHFNTVFQPLNICFWLAQIAAKGHHTISMSNHVLKRSHKLDSHFCNTNSSSYFPSTMLKVNKKVVCQESKMFQPFTSKLKWIVSVLTSHVYSPASERFKGSMVKVRLWPSIRALKRSPSMGVQAFSQCTIALSLDT